MSNENKNNIIVIDEIPPYDTEDYDLFDEKDFAKYVADVEKIVRSSFEYHEFTNYLREYMDMNKCSFFENVNNMNSFKIKIHIHHHPLTLYEISMIIYQKRQFYQESLEVEMVAKEVMYVHYFLMVGLIPLSETVHELTHKQIIFIPLDKVMGNWEEFLDTYEDFILPETKDKIMRYREQTVLFNEEQNRKYLTADPVYIHMNDETALTVAGTLKISEMNTIVNAMNQRIDYLKQQKYIALEDKNTIDQEYDSLLDKTEDNREPEAPYMPIYFVE